MSDEWPGEPQALQLGASNEVLELETAAQNRHLTLLMTQQARGRIRIISRHLDPAIYDSAAFIDAVRTLLTGQPRSRVEILLKDCRPAIQRGHRVLALAQRLTSYIEIRRMSPRHGEFNSAYFIVDRCGYIDRIFADRFEGAACFNDPRGCKARLESFQALWQEADIDPEIRRLP